MTNQATSVHLIQPPKAAPGTQRSIKTSLSSAYLQRPAAACCTNLGCFDLAPSIERALSYVSLTDDIQSKPGSSVVSLRANRSARYVYRITQFGKPSVSDT